MVGKGQAQKSEVCEVSRTVTEISDVSNNSEVDRNNLGQVSKCEASKVLPHHKRLLTLNYETPY